MLSRCFRQQTAEDATKHLTNYERWQMEKYGNVLPEQRSKFDTPDDEKDNQENNLIHNDELPNQNV